MNIDALFYLDKVQRLVVNLPGVTERPCYGTPGFYAGKKLFARLREEGDILVVFTEEGHTWMKKDPEAFYITDHYKNSMYILVTLNKVRPDDLVTILTAAWASRTGKKILQDWQNNMHPANRPPIHPNN